MTWATVNANLEFYTSSPQNWTPILGGSVTTVSSAHKDRIRDYLETLYNGSSEAQRLLDAASGAGNIRIGTAARFTNDAGFAAGYSDIPGSYLAVNLAVIDELYYFNKQGKFVKELPALSIIHEFAHFVDKSADPIYSISAMNGVNFNFEGAALHTQNIIAQEMGYTENEQVSYYAAVLSADARFSLLEIGREYTEGHTINVARLGDQGGAAGDVMDHRSRTDDSSDLMFGFSDDDEIYGGGGNDYLYGGADWDYIEGGEGDDVLYADMAKPLLTQAADSGVADELFGEAGRDSLFGAGGDDWLEGGDGNDLLMGGAGADNLLGGDGDDIIMPGANGSSWFDSNDVIDGGDGADWIWLDRDVDVTRIEIVDRGADDKLFWNGYQLAGGAYTMIDEDGLGEYYRMGYLDSNGVIYRYSDGTLSISLPTSDPFGGDALILADWSNGDLGITLDLDWLEEDLATLVLTLPRSDIANDGFQDNWADLDGRVASLAAAGPEALPMAPFV